MLPASASPASLANRLETQVTGVTYTGGIIGLFTNKKRRLQTEIQRMNDQGYRLRHVLPVKVNVLTLLAQLFFLTITLLLWAPEAGETLVFERVS